MGETRVKDGNFITIQSFMVKELKLKGNELLIYAIIYGFSQDGEQRFTGSQQYLADWTNSTRQGVNKALKSLVEKEYIYKIDNLINNVKFCEYGAKFPITNKMQQVETEFTGDVNKVDTGVKQSLQGGSKQSLQNNISLNNIENNTVIKKERKTKTFDDIILEYAKTIDVSMRAEVTNLLIEWLKVRKAKRAALTDKAIQMNIDKLDKLAAESNMTVCEYLSEVICRGWAAFYPITNYKRDPKPFNNNTAGKKSEYDDFMAELQEMYEG